MNVGIALLLPHLRMFAGRGPYPQVLHNAPSHRCPARLRRPARRPPGRRPRRRPGPADRPHLLPADRQDQRHGHRQRASRQARRTSSSLDGTALNGGTQLMDDRRRDAGHVRRRRRWPTTSCSARSASAVASGGLTASAKFTVTRLKANFTPSQGDPHQAEGPVLGRGLRPRRPQPGRLRPLRHAQGQAEADDPARPGDRPVRADRQDRQAAPVPVRRSRRWASGSLQFDTTKTFAQGTRTSKFLFYSVGRVPAAARRAGSRARSRPARSRSSRSRC